MYNFHPPFSGFPFALLTVVVLAEAGVIFWRSTRLEWVAFINLMLAGVFTLIAFLSGYQALRHASATFTVPDTAITQHYILGKIVLIAVLLSVCLKICHMRAVYNRAFFGALYGVALFVAYSAVIYTGYLGGQLVFKYGAAVKAVH
jgi:uncharacterized membrane protein